MMKYSRLPKQRREEKKKKEDFLFFEEYIYTMLIIKYFINLHTISYTDTFTRWQYDTGATKVIKKNNNNSAMTMKKKKKNKTRNPRIPSVCGHLKWKFSEKMKQKWKRCDFREIMKWNELWVRQQKISWLTWKVFHSMP